MLNILCALSVFLAVIGFSQADLKSEYQNCTQLYPKNESLAAIYTMCWTYNSNEKTMSFAVKAKTTGRVGFGLANEISNTTGYDVAVGYFDDFTSQVVFNDFHTTGYNSTSFIKDTQQDLMNKSVSEASGYTTLKFKRKLNTNDKNDTIIKEGPMIVVWSYSNHDSFISQDAKKGYETITLIPKKASYETITLIPKKASYETITLIPKKASDNGTTPTTGTVAPVTVGAAVYHVSWLLMALSVVLFMASANSP